jgi:hypothetical protein
MMIFSANEGLVITAVTTRSICLPFTLHHKLSITRLYLAKGDVIFKDTILRSAFGSCESFIIQVGKPSFLLDVKQYQ